MKKKYIILLASAIPCIFLGMYGDAALHTMVLYLPAVLVFSLLCALSVKTRSVGLLLLGNGLSALTSTNCIAGRTPDHEIIVSWHGFWLALDLTAQV